MVMAMVMVLVLVLVMVVLMVMGKGSLAHELAIARAVGYPEECGANKMQAEREREGVITIELMMPIIMILQLISRVESVKAARRADNLLISANLADVMTQTVLSQYNERHGPADITDDWFTALEKGFDQWVPFFQESGQPTDINESQLIQMFGHVNTHLPAHQSAPQEPRTPEQTTTAMPAATPGKLDLASPCS